MKTRQSLQNATRRLNLLYIIALSAIALLALSGQIIIQYALAQQSADANVINLAGRQRFSSQQLVKAALVLATSTDPALRKYRLDEINRVLPIWERSHQGLQHGDAALNMPGKNSAAVSKLFADIQPYFEIIRSGTREILVLIDQKGLDNLTLAEVNPVAQRMLAVDLPFLEGMHAITTQYAVESTEAINQLKLIELTLFCLTVFILFLEGFLIFRPAVGHIRDSQKYLVRAEDLAQALQKLENQQEHSQEISQKILEMAEELKVTADQQAVSSQEQVTIVVQVNASMDELSITAANIAEIAHDVDGITKAVVVDCREIETTTNLSNVQAQAGQAAVESTMAISQEVNYLHSQLVNILTELNNKTTNMQTAINLLRYVAGETHLLALNAAIEAAGAGQYGERFRIVAQEVKVLAGQSGKAGKEVIEAIQEVIEITQTAVNLANNGFLKTQNLASTAEQAGLVINKMQNIAHESMKQAQSINLITQKARSMTDIIRTSTFQQQTASKQVSEALRNLNQTAARNATDSKQVFTTAQNLEETSQNLHVVLH